MTASVADAFFRDTMMGATPDAGSDVIEVVAVDAVSKTLEGVLAVITATGGFHSTPDTPLDRS